MIRSTRKPRSPAAKPMLTLLLLRHAKSSRDDPNLADRDRPLAPRGREAAPRIGRYLGRNDLIPDLVLCSPAVRARETLELVLAEIGTPPPIRIDEAIYDFGDGGALLDAVRRIGASAKRVLVVGHNPALERLARALAGEGEKELQRRLNEKFPTAALAVLVFPAARWSDIGPRAGTLVEFVTPKSLGN